MNGGGNYNIPIRRIRQTETLFLILYMRFFHIGGRSTTFFNTADDFFSFFLHLAGRA